MTIRIAPGGLPLAAALIGSAAVAGFIGWYVVAAALVGLAVFVVAFYRDPDRTPAGTGILAPADGHVRSISVDDGGRVRLSIFLNLWHVHVVRTPVAGQVHTVERVAGHRKPAFLARAAENAGVSVGIDEWNVILKAGLIARRVRSYVEYGEQLRRGERIGHIAFGSRVDIVFPRTIDRSDLTVGEGDRVYAGHTVMASAASTQS